jgi:uncharacterized protein
VRLVTLRSCLYRGQLVHTRHGRAAAGFRHPVYMWLVDLDELPQLDRRLRWFGYDRPALTSIRSADHLGDPARPLRANLLAYLDRHGIGLDGGRVELLANARLLGYVFNPLTLYWCHRRDGALACVLAEVHNTYGERHCYLLSPDDRHHCQAGKQFYVSPFLTVDGHYRMTVPPPGPRLSVHMQLVQGGEGVFQASLTGRRVELTSAALGRMLVRHPLMPERVSALIRWHGLGLWLRGAGRVRRPQHIPQEGVGHPR